MPDTKKELNEKGSDTQEQASFEDYLDKKIALSPLDSVDDFMDKHWSEVRMFCLYGSVLLMLIAIRNSNSFKRLRTLRELTELKGWRGKHYRVFIVHAELNAHEMNLTLYGYHTPWLRNLLGIHPRKITLANQTWPLHLAGVNFPPSPHISDVLIQERFARKWFNVEILDVDDSSSGQSATCILHKSKISPFLKDEAILLLKEGLACVDHKSFKNQTYLSSNHFSLLEKYEAAEQYARKRNLGIWTNIPYQRNLLGEGMQSARKTVSLVSGMLTTLSQIVKRFR